MDTTPSQVQTGVPAATARPAVDHDQSVLKEILTTLQKSTIVPHDAVDKWVRFWNIYKREADEYDAEFLIKYKEDMNTSMIFSGLFSAVTATVASMTVSDLGPDPNQTTQVLLQNILLVLNHTSGPLPHAIALPTWQGPSVTVIWVQSLLYASLACSLFAALGAVLGTQWLSRYSSVGERGTLEDRCKERQTKLDGLTAWHFRRVLEALSVLLQVSLLLFGVAISGFMWTQQHIVAAVLIAVTGLGAIFYFSSIGLSIVYSDCPYYTPLTDALPRLYSFNSWAIRSASSLAIYSFKSIPTFIGSASISALGAFYVCVRTLTRLPYYIFALPVIMLVDLAATAIEFCLGKRPRRQDGRLPSGHRRGGTNSSHGDRSMTKSFRTEVHRRSSEGLGVLMWFPALVATNVKKRAVRFQTRSIAMTQDHSPATGALAWILETSTDPRIRVDALLLVAETEWPQTMIRSHLSSSMLDFLLQQMVLCFSQPVLEIPHMHLPTEASEQRVGRICAAFLFIYWELQILEGDVNDAWGREVGLAFCRQHEPLMHALRELAPSGASPARNEDQRALYLMFLTLNRHAVQVFDPVPIIRYAGTSTSTELLCARTLLYLAQASTGARWNALRQAALLDTIGSYQSNWYSTESKAICLSAYAVVLRYHFKGTSDLAREQLESHHGPACAEYLLGQVTGLLSWQLSGATTSEPSVVAVLDIQPGDQEQTVQFLRLSIPIFEDGILSLGFLQTTTASDWLLDVCSLLYAFVRHPVRLSQSSQRAPLPGDFIRVSIRDAISRGEPGYPAPHLTLQHIQLLAAFLRPCVRAAALEKGINTPTHASQLDHWTPRVLHILWLTDFLKQLHSFVEVNAGNADEEIWDAAADAYLLAARMICSSVHDVVMATHMNRDVIDADHIPSLVDINWSTFTGQDLIPTPASLRFYSAASCFIDALIKNPHATLVPTGGLPALMLHLRLLATQPARSLSNSQSVGHHVYVRDKTFIDHIFAAMPHEKDTWFNDVENDPTIRTWIHIIERWMIPHDTGSSWAESRAQDLSVRSLLACQRVHDTTDTVWDSDLDHVQRVAVIAVWHEWKEWCNADRALYDPNTLVVRTLDVLGVAAYNASEVEWYLRDLQSLLRDVQRRPWTEHWFGLEHMQAVSDTLVAKLAEVQEARKATHEQHLPVSMGDMGTVQDADGSLGG
ncbi:hypothetical protein EIP91_005768 [Steccherinum ochraceum]|uniref:DUF6535 domain-containing protein n=1 Tax=Steccherinum ochraceum TaxID=92696 RepID=A0A4R0RHQ5_9APHY|nr:hypothetical protein EIP91_005768 [Steccherinum ochraceum]